MAGNPMPAAEADVTADLVRRLLAGQHPDLAHLPVEFLANGWDNVMFRVGDELAARMPRRALGAEILVHEQRWLPLLAPWLPLNFALVFLAFSADNPRMLAIGRRTVRAVLAASDEF
jgi:aminoglycoside phosphotransferase (APT) family kinase protein